MPEIRFDDVMVASIPQTNTCLSVDSKYLAVCAAGTVQVCGCVPDAPVLVGAVVDGDKIRVQFADQRAESQVKLVLRLTGIRKGFVGHRLPDRTREQFEANERFIRSAY